MTPEQRQQKCDADDNVSERLEQAAAAVRAAEQAVPAAQADDEDTGANSEMPLLTPEKPQSNDEDMSKMMLAVQLQQERDAKQGHKKRAPPLPPPQ